VTERTDQSTATGGVVIERKYRTEDGQIEQSSVVVSSDNVSAGDVDVILVEPIDYEAELARREKTHEPIEPVDTDLTNTAFGI
jgi:hypothetical protein